MAERQAATPARVAFYVVPGEIDEDGRVLRLTAPAIDARLAHLPERQRFVLSATDQALADAIGMAIVERRKALGWSQDALAVAVGCDRSAVCRWEIGQRLPSLSNLAVLGQVLGCGIRALLPEEPEPEADCR